MLHRGRTLSCAIVWQTAESKGAGREWPASRDGILRASPSTSIKSIESVGFYGIIGDLMKISQKGLYALQAMMMLARHHHQGAIKIRDVAYEEDLPEKFLELILLELKNARMVESVRGAKGGYQLRREPGEIRVSEIVQL